MNYQATREQKFMGMVGASCFASVMVWIFYSTLVLSRLDTNIGFMIENQNQGQGQVQHLSEIADVETTEERERQVKRSDFVLDPEFLRYDDITGLYVIDYDRPALQSDNSKSKKAINWWWVGFAWKVSETGLAIDGLRNDCRDFSKDTSQTFSGIKCIHGAISTLITFAGATYATYQTITFITWFINQGVAKRDSITNEEIFGHLVDYQNNMSKGLNANASILFDGDGSMLTFEGSSYIPALHINTKHSSNSVVGFGLQPNNVTGVTTVMTSIKPNTGLKRRGYNTQIFDHGGLEMGTKFNYQDGALLSTVYDYDDAYKYVTCNFTPMEYNTLDFQIFDDNHDGAITAGVIRAFEWFSYDLNSLYDIRTGIVGNGNCRNIF